MFYKGFKCSILASCKNNSCKNKFRVATCNTEFVARTTCTTSRLNLQRNNVATQVENIFCLYYFTFTEKRWLCIIWKFCHLLMTNERTIGLID